MRKLYRKLRNHIRHWSRMFWLSRAGSSRFGRLAAWWVSRNDPPFHGRAYLADLSPRGFISASAHVSHAGLRLGRHVYLGERVTVYRSPEGGPVEIEDRVQLYGDSFLETGAGGSVCIGSGTHIQPGCHIHAYLTEIAIGKQVEIAPGCGFYCYDHSMEPGIPIREQPMSSRGGITVGDGAWIGHAVTVLQGVNIGEGAVIAAGSVVTRDVPANAIAAGVPARVIGFRGGETAKETNRRKSGDLATRQ